MSRIGRLPIAIPTGVDVVLDGQQVDVKGPKGSLTLTVAEPITIEKQEDGQLAVGHLGGARVRQVAAPAPRLGASQVLHGAPTSWGRLRRRPPTTAPARHTAVYTATRTGTAVTSG